MNILADVLLGGVILGGFAILLYYKVKGKWPAFIRDRFKK